MTPQNEPSGSPVADEMERRIEQTRQRLSQTLEALEAKLSPRVRLRSAAEKARTVAGKAADTGGRWAKRGMESVVPDITTMIRIDHTHVLMLFRRCRPWTSMSRKTALIESACLALEIHAQLEEEIFYPALREAGLGSDILDKSVPEHDEMRAQIAALRASAAEFGDFERRFQELMRTVLHHVADEETILLPLAEEALPDKMAELGMRMTQRRMELLKPHLGEVAMTTARSFPYATAAAAAGILAVGWMVLRPSRSARNTDLFH